MYELGLLVKMSRANVTSGGEDPSAAPGGSQWGGWGGLGALSGVGGGL